MKNEITTMPTLTGDELLTKIEEMRAANHSNTEIAHACGYTKPNGNPAFVEFYTAMIAAKGVDELNADTEMSDHEVELRERFGDDAVDAFIDYWSIDDLEYFEVAYQSAERPEDFARELTESYYGPNGLDLPIFVEIDWSATWDNLRDDFIELDGYIFSLNW